MLFIMLMTPIAVICFLVAFVCLKKNKKMQALIFTGCGCFLLAVVGVLTFAGHFFIQETGL